MRTVQMQSRSAAEVAATVRPLLAPGEAAVAQDPVLILKASPARLDELEALVRDLDRAAVRLRIHVRQAGSAQRSGAGVGVGVAGARGPVRIETPGAPDRGVRVYGTARTDARTRESTQFVSATAGQPAWLNVGLSVPLTTHDHGHPYGPGGVSHGVEYRDVSTGFAVIPRVHGDTVTLQIDPHDERLGRAGTVRFAAASTTVSGPLGAWLPLAGVVQAAGRDTRGLLAGTGVRSGGETHIEVMVERW